MTSHEHLKPSIPRVVIVGAGHGGVQLAFELRSMGWGGEIVLLESQAEAPYERPPLSKSLDSPSELVKTLRGEQSYAAQAIDLRLKSAVRVIDPAQQSVALADGSVIEYTQLVLATGARAIYPFSEGPPAGVHSLRTLADARELRRSIASGTDVVIIGGGYIGLEVASSLSQMNVGSVHVIEAMDRLLARVASPTISNFAASLLNEAGQFLHLSKSVSALLGSKRVTAVVVDEMEIEADTVVIGAGVTPNVEVAQCAGLRIDGGIPTNEYGRTSCENIFAIGDVARFGGLDGPSRRIESIPNAQMHARILAAHLCGREEVWTVPWFWSHQFGHQFNSAGVVSDENQTITRLHDRNSFSVLHLKGSQLVAIESVNHQKDFNAGRSILAHKCEIDLIAAADPSVRLAEARI